jgi:mannose-6-phosphate isomerase-like protein (cupin superfamily)
MRYLRHSAFIAVAALGIFSMLPGQRAVVKGQGQETLAWAPVPNTPTGWAAPNKPIWKLKDLLADHKGQASWTQTVVSDNLLHADYISMAPGEKTPRRFHPDNPEWWIVQDGQIRFTIEGQEPFVASKGWLVQVPYRNTYSMETVGNAPSLRLEVNVANATTLYPIDETPTPIPGMNFIKVNTRNAAKGKYNATNKPFLDFNSMVAAGSFQQTRFVVDDRAFANIIRGRQAERDNPLDNGHMHEVSGEFWMILEGQIEYKIAGIPTFVADQGDIVYAPKQTYHRAHFAGTGPSTRLAMNGYPDMLHNYQPNADMQAPRP